MFNDVHIFAANIFYFFFFSCFLNTDLDALEAALPDLQGLLLGELPVPVLDEEGGQEVELEVHLTLLPLLSSPLLGLPSSLQRQYFRSYIKKTGLCFHYSQLPGPPVPGPAYTNIGELNIYHEFFGSVLLKISGFLGHFEQITINIFDSYMFFILLYLHSLVSFSIEESYTQSGVGFFSHPPLEPTNHYPNVNQSSTNQQPNLNQSSTNHHPITKQS